MAHIIATLLGSLNYSIIREINIQIEKTTDTFNYEKESFSTGTLKNYQLLFSIIVGFCGTHLGILEQNDRWTLQGIIFMRINSSIRNYGKRYFIHFSILG